MSPIVRFLLILAHLSIFIILLSGNDNYTSKENTISTKDAPAYESLLISQSDLETKSQEKLLKAQADIYSNQLKLKEALTGHYFGFNEEEESVYIELTPYVYKKFMFKGQIDLESYANPEIGLWGVTENEQILLEKILSEDDTIEFTPFAIKEGALIYDEKEIHLDKVGPNFVPGLFHFQRSLDYEEGYFSSYDSSGQISVQNDFPDNKLILNQEALDLTKLGYMYQHGKLFYDGKNGYLTDQTLVAEEEFIDDDVGMAFTLYQKAAKLNYPPAMHNLASLYYEGKVEGNKNMAKAVEWLNAAVNSGYTSSEELLATILYDGADGVPQDKERAINLWRTAALKGNAEAQYKLGSSFLWLDEPTVQNVNEGEFWLNAAAGRDVPEAFLDLALINLIRARDEGDSNHYSMKAIQFLYQARSLGNAEATQMINDYQKELLPDFYEKQKTNTLNDNEVEITTTGSVYIIVMEGVEDNESKKRTIISKEFSADETFVFERESEVHLAFTDGSKVSFRTGYDPIWSYPISDGKGRVVIPNRSQIKDNKSEDLSKVLPTKENLVGHYLGEYETENGDIKHTYIILNPHIYIAYDLGETVSFNELQNPSMGTWGIDESKPWFIRLDTRRLGSEFIFIEHFKILADRNLEQVKTGAILEKTNENMVPMMFHVRRGLLDKGHTKFYEDGKLFASKAFSDNKEIYSEEGLDLYNMGVFYENGTTSPFSNFEYLEIEHEERHFEVDLNKAMHYYKLSAEMSYPPAMYNLAAFYEFGIVGEPDIEEAAKWYTASAQAGYTAALYKLGKMYAFGKGGLAIDEEKGIKLILDAAKNGCRRAEYNVGLHYFYDDLPLDVDLEKAEMYLRRAASKGHPDAYYQLALVYRKKIDAEGSDDSPLVEEMLAYVLTAADLGNEKAIEIANQINGE